MSRIYIASPPYRLHGGSGTAFIQFGDISYISSSNRIIQTLLSTINLSAIKIRSTNSFGGEIKPSVPCRKILRHFEELYKCERDTCGQNSQSFFAKFLLLSY
jgi:hypothetical protein